MAIGVYRGTTKIAANKIFRGTTPIVSVWRGTTRVWPSDIVYTDGPPATKIGDWSLQSLFTSALVGDGIRFTKTGTGSAVAKLGQGFPYDMPTTVLAPYRFSLRMGSGSSSGAQYSLGSGIGDRTYSTYTAVAPNTTYEQFLVAYDSRAIATLFDPASSAGANHAVNSVELKALPTVVYYEDYSPANNTTHWTQNTGTTKSLQADGIQFSGNSTNQAWAFLSTPTPLVIGRSYLLSIKVASNVNCTAITLFESSGGTGTSLDSRYVVETNYLAIKFTANATSFEATIRNDGWTTGANSFTVQEVIMFDITE